MRRPKGVKLYRNAPADLEYTPAVTGDSQIDSAIMQNPSAAMADKLDLYTTKGNPYAPRTGYDGYGGYHGDD